jgi:hypothetical protein
MAKKLTNAPTLDELEALYQRLWLVGAAPRSEDRKKLEELEALIPLVLPRLSSSGGIWVDACAGKSALGIMTMATRNATDVTGAWQLRCIERQGRLLQQVTAAAAIIGIEVDARAQDVEPGAFAGASLVVALHACGAASDAIIDAAIANQTHSVMLVPCCYGDGAALPPHVDAWCPRSGVLRSRLARAWVDAQRTLRLEAAGYAVEVIEFVAPTVTPHNLLWRAQHTGNPSSRRAKDAGARLQQTSGPA